MLRPLIPEKAPGSHSNEGWMDPTVGLDAMEKETLDPAEARTSIPRSASP
jgi:hypothetical protein